MKCRFWTTIFSLLLLAPVMLAAQGLTVEANLENRRRIGEEPPRADKSSARFSAVRGEGGTWLVRTFSGVWDGREITAENYVYDPKAQAKGPVARALGTLIPYATENIAVPEKSQPLEKSHMHELLRNQGFEPEKMQLTGQWSKETARTVLVIKGSGGGQRIDYRMVLAGKDKEITFDYEIAVKMPENDPLTVGLEFKSSGKGTVKITSDGPK